MKNTSIIGAINNILTGITTPNQCGPGSIVNEEALYIPKSSLVSNPKHYFLSSLGRIQNGASSLGQSWAGSNTNEEALNIHKSPQIKA